MGTMVVCCTLASVAIGGMGQPPDQGKSLDALREKYTFRSIYLTYIPLHSLTLLLNEDEKYKKLQKDPLWRDSLPVLKKYLNDNQQPELNRALAFLQLDLGSLQAGVKSMSDRGAEITKLPWGNNVVTSVALFSDLFLSGQLKAETVAGQIATGKVGISKVWDEIATLKEDPFVPTHMLAKPLQDLQKLIELKPDDMKKLQRDDKLRFDKIQKFRLGLRPTARESDLQAEEWATISKQLKLLDRREYLRDVDALESYFKAIDRSPPPVIPPGGTIPNYGSLFTPSKAPGITSPPR